jgi:hypothetical protein
VSRLSGFFAFLAVLACAVSSALDVAATKRDRRRQP